MAIKNTLLGGTNWIDGEVLYSADLNDTNDAMIAHPLKLIKLNPFSQIGKIALNYTWIMPYTSTRWQSDDYITTDAGTTASATNSTEEFGWLNLEDKTKGFSCSSNMNIIRYTINSGANWTTGTTAPANSNAVQGGDYSLDGLIYLAGWPSSGTGLWYSTNDGVDFTQVAGAHGNFAGVGMHDATHGIAINVDAKIWYTVNGTTWTDSGHVYDGDHGINRADVYCYASGGAVTDFKCLILERHSANDSLDFGPGGVEYYDGTGDTEEVFFGGVPAPYGTTTNFTLLDNGSLCFVYANTSESANPQNLMTANLVVCTNPTASVITGGVLTTCPNFYQIPLGLCGKAGDYDLCLPASDSMNQYDTNKILINLACRKLFQIDLNGLD